MKLKLLLLVILCVLLFLSIKKVLADSPVPLQVPLESPTSLVATTSPEFERIGWCESRHDLHAKNPYSSASGEYQWVNSSWYYYGKKLWGEDFYTKNIWSEDNRLLAWYVYSTYGTAAWQSSRTCWSVV